MTCNVPNSYDLLDKFSNDYYILDKLSNDYDTANIIGNLAFVAFCWNYTTHLLWMTNSANEIPVIPVHWFAVWGVSQYQNMLLLGWKAEI